MNEAQEIAETIRQQLNATAREKVWSWGSRHWKYGITADENKNPYLIFRVSGFLYKGLVRILLRWNDTYTLQLVTKDGKVTKELDDVYVDNMAEIIDSWVEHDGDNEKYAERCAKAKYKI